MAHIISCMLDAADEDFSLLLSNYIARAVTPQSSYDSLDRIQQHDRKNQLFSKLHEPDKAYAYDMSQNGGDKTDKTDKADKQQGGGLITRIKEHNLTRRRKISVPELAPMTTVHEGGLDSPTIPGRPPLHERSISVPVNTTPTWRPQQTGDCMMHSRPTSPLPGQPPISPTRNLAPLVIPIRNGTQSNLSRFRSGSGASAPDVPGRRNDETSRSKRPFTPVSGTTTTPRSAATSATTASTLPTPVSTATESRFSPRPGESSPSEARADGVATPTNRPDVPEQRPASAADHRRNLSDASSVMERGRPRKRTDTSEKPSRSKSCKSAERRAFELLPKGWKASEAAALLSEYETRILQRQALQQAARFVVLRKEDVDSLSRELRQLDERCEYLRRTYTSLRAGRRNLHTRICQYLRCPRTAKFSPDSMLKQEEALAELDSSIDDWVNKLEQAENRRTRVRQKLLEHVAAAVTLPVANRAVNKVSEGLQLAIGVRPPCHAAPGVSTPPRSPTKPPTAVKSPSPPPSRIVAQVPSTIVEQPLVKDLASPVGAELMAIPKASTTPLASVTRRQQPATSDKGGNKAPGLCRAETIRIYADNDVYDLLADVENTMTNMGGPDDKVNHTTDAQPKRILCQVQSHDILKTRAPSSPLIKKPASPVLRSVSPTMKSTFAPAVDNTTALTKPVKSSTPSCDETAGCVLLTNAVFKKRRESVLIA